jgi:hypothetical protein
MEGIPRTLALNPVGGFPHGNPLSGKSKEATSRVPHVRHGFRRGAGDL